ncbi:hypothetical protein JW926_03050 [Candidatus Sumerlaeota bacterium]|nr:hypothetical protein [Candidatus Sumerlaeota bacterium]
MISESIKSALEESAAELCLGRRVLFKEDDLSVFLAYYIEELLLHGIIKDPSEFIHTGDKRLIELLENNSIFQHGLDGFALHDLLDNEYYMEKVVRLAYNKRLAGRDSPSLRISPNKMDSAQFSEAINLGLIFGSEPFSFQDTLHCWHIDEAKSFTSNNTSFHPVNVMGVHYEWLTGDLKASRALIVDEGSLVKEVDFNDPAGLDVVHITELPLAGERSLHQKLSRAFSERNIAQIDPYPPSVCADDKFCAYKKLISRGINTPHAFLLPRNKSYSDYKKFMERIWEEIKQTYGNNPITLFVQPDHGTEGRMVEAFDLCENCDGESLLRHITKTGERDEALLRVKKGNVRYCKEKDKGYRNIVFRINVAWNGIRYIAQSGFAQVAPHENNPVASRGRGGSIIDIHEALENIFFMNKDSKSWGKVFVKKMDVDEMKHAAEQAAGALDEEFADDDKLKLLGVDVLLEYKDEHIIPCILEINPRLAGLNHSASIDNQEYYVSRDIFDYLREIKKTGEHRSGKLVASGEGVTEK